MKKFFTMFACLWAFLSATAQTGMNEIRVREAGTLESIIEKYSLQQAEWLKISGDLNGSDIKVLRRMLGGIYNSPSEPREGNLRRLDLTNANIVEGGDPYLCVITASGPDVPKLYTSDGTISYEMFWNCENLEDIRLPVSATKIESESFMYSEYLKSVTIPEGVSRLDGYDFCHCHALKNISLPSTVTELGGYLVDYCPSLKTFACAATEPPVCAEETFSNVEGVTLYVPAGSADKYRQSAGWSKFGEIVEVDPMNIHVDEPGTLDSLVSVLSLRGAERMKITGCLNGSDIRTLRYLLGGFFTIVTDTQRWGKLRELDLSEATIVSGGEGYFLRDWMNGVTVEEATLFTSEDAIGSFMFFDCRAMRDLKLPGNITEVGGLAFWNCPELRSMVIPEGVPALEEGVFQSCHSLESVTLPSTIERVEMHVVHDCPSLKTFICTATQPPVCADEAFDDVSGVTLYVPEGSAWKYRQSEGWSKFGDIIEFEFLGISGLQPSASKLQGVVHDLQGRRLASPPEKGVYIQDGKKYVK
jgi:hypothetical protein